MTVWIKWQFNFNVIIVTCSELRTTSNTEMYNYFF